MTDQYIPTTATNPPARSRTIPARGIGLIVGLGALLILGGYFLLVRPGSAPRTVTAIGLADLEFPADTAELTLLYTARGTDKRLLNEVSTVEFETILQDLRNAQAESVSASSSQVVPLSSGNGFEFRQAILVRANGSNKIQQILTLMGTKDVLVAQTRYLPQDTTKVQQTLLDTALTNAKEKAQNMASSSKSTLGTLLSVSEAGSTAETGSLVSSKADTGSQFTTIRLQKTVTATYELR